jgi:hypothetical protein
MKNANEFLIHSAKVDFGILKKWTNLKLMTSDEVLENLKNLVGFRIQKMLDHDYSSLLELLYKSDISETKVRSCFDAKKTSKEIANELAELYIQRMRQKWQTRLLYDDPDVKGDWD